MTGTVKFAKDGSGDVDIKGWCAVKINPSADAVYYFNADSTKTYPLMGGVDNLIFCSHDAVVSFSIVLGTATASVQGM